MRDGPFELKVIVLDNNKVLDEADKNLFSAYEVDIDNVRYAEVESGKSFAVQVVIHQSYQGSHWFKNYVKPPKHVRIGLYVDGIDVQYWKRLDLTDPGTTLSSIFWGFKENSVSNSLRSFTFAQTKENGDTGNLTKAPDANIRVVFFEAEEVGGIYSNQSTHSEALPVAPVILKEGKKFWEQASVTTIAGEVVNPNIERFVPVKRWRNVTSQPMHTMTMFYHTKSMIRCLRTIKTSTSNKRGDLTDHADRATKQRRLNQTEEDACANNSDDETVALPEEFEPRANPAMIDLTSDNEEDSNGNNDSNGRRISSSNNNSSSSSSSSSSATNTTGSTSNVGVNGSSGGSNSGNSLIHVSERMIDDEITIVEVRKQIPILDLTES